MFQYDLEFFQVLQFYLHFLVLIPGMRWEATQINVALSIGFNVLDINKEDVEAMGFDPEVVFLVFRVVILNTK